MGIFYPPFGFINGFKTFYHSLAFPGCERFLLSHLKVDIIFFSRNFLHFFKISSFLYRFFFLASTGETFFVTQPWEPWTLLLQRTFPVAPYIQSRIPYILLTLCFSLLFVLVWRFFFLKALWLNFLLLWMPPFCSPHNLSFFWRGYSVLVLLRDNICIFLFGAQFFYPGQSFASLPLNTVAFFLANHCEIWPSMALYFGSTSASGQLPTYPSPNPTTVYWSQVRVNVGLGEGRWAL